MTPLPESFSDLAPFADWCLDTQDARQLKRRNSSTEQLRAFYAAMTPRMRDILKEVDQFPLGTLPESHRGLFSLALSFAEVAPNIELYGGSPSVPYAVEESRMKARHGQNKTWEGHRSR